MASAPPTDLFLLASRFHFPARFYLHPRPSSFPAARRRDQSDFCACIPKTGGGNFSFGDAIYYDELYLGYKTSFGLQITFRPLTSLRFHYNAQNEEFYKRKGGEKVYSVNIISQRVVYQLSRTISLRLITDYNDYDKEIYNSVLFSYEFRPGTAFYFGIDDSQIKDEAGIFRKDSRYFFVKFSYWWRI